MTMERSRLFERSENQCRDEPSGPSCLGRLRARAAILHGRATSRTGLKVRPYIPSSSSRRQSIDNSLPPVYLRT
jgi:hypothetical protein